MLRHGLEELRAFVRLFALTPLRHRSHRTQRMGQKRDDVVDEHIMCKENGQ